ncbi:MAG: AIR synthase [Sulfobacillus thermosulfidooxidans]|uniref:AIR synthase n=1 Tax=Sulfobacillus thermotolerans TaxID=338644 RepID=A0ABN5H3Z5_9FIRM|nr:AIR synthase family protein [Sulfobacillus sp. hq2]AUW94203.1 AIR synthase [Sulfobacillus thermotolerans]MCY0907588.1 AIR synthase family protein [Sulfobacillus thermotolerans]POB09528.1 AIR synthase [Sulfobacillus sp. hq2]PSR37358.1 MAG: AIR synthase [Sulfobacillus thermosulfidooxidans]
MGKSEMPAMGKISPEVFRDYVYPNLGQDRPEVLVGPRSGVDIAITRVAPGTVMATTTDPVFIVPAYGWERAAWFAVHILASDAATSGLPPSLMTVDLNLPLTITTQDFQKLWEAFAKTCQSLGIAVVSGHTARYEGCDFPMVGGATVMSIGPEDRYVTTAMAEVGDLLLCTKGAAIETTGLMAATFPDYIRQHLGHDLWARADALFDEMTVVTDALTAAAQGVRSQGVTAMHDATECGVVGGVYEIAEASGLGVVMRDEAVIVREETKAICDLTGIDPLIAISEGTLLLTVKPHAVDKVMRALKAQGIDVSVIGEMRPASEGMWREAHGRRMPLVHPRIDPFWAAFGALAAGRSPK